MRLSTLLVCFGLASGAAAQSFQTHIGDIRHQDAVAAFSDAQGILVVVRDAPMGVMGASSARVRLLRTNTDGVEQTWYDVNFPGSAFVQGVIREGTTALILCGSFIRAGRSDQDAFIAKVDLTGNVQWTWSTDTPGLEEELLDVARTPDGRYAAGGVRRAGADSDAYLALVSAMGDLEWSTHIGGANDEQVNALLADGVGLTCAGQVANDTMGWNAYVLRTDLGGVEQWSQERGGRKADVARAVVALTSSQFIWAGYTDSFGDTTHYGRRKRNIRLMAMTVAGDSLWAKAIGDTLVDRSAFSIARFPNGDLLIGGKRAPAVDGEALAVRTNSLDGTVLWQRGYDVLGEDELRSLFIQAGDGGFIGSGWCFGDHGGDVLLLRKDGQGN